MCAAGTRVFVHEKIYDEFLQKFTAKAQSLIVGDPFAADTYQGPQVSQSQFDVSLAPTAVGPFSDMPPLYQRIMGYIKSGKEQGATVHTGGVKHGTAGYFIEPTIFTDTRPDMKIVREEIFGPVGVVIKFSDEEDVIRQANDSQYGLAASVFTKDIQRALRVAHRLQAGTVGVNCVGVVSTAIPFGGYKQVIPSTE